MIVKNPTFRKGETTPTGSRPILSQPDEIQQTPIQRPTQPPPLPPHTSHSRSRIPSLVDVESNPDGQNVDSSFFTEDESDHESPEAIGTNFGDTVLNDMQSNFYKQFSNYLPPLITPLTLTLPNSLLNPPNSILKF